MYTGMQVELTIWSRRMKAVCTQALPSPNVQNMNVHGEGSHPITRMKPAWEKSRKNERVL